MNTKVRLGIYFLVLLSTSVLTSVYASPPVFDEYFDRVKRIVSELERVSKEDVDTSKVEYYLNNALGLLSKEDLTAIEKKWVDENLSLAERELGLLINNLGSHVLWRNIRLSLTIVFLTSIPVLTYILLPRIWAYAWFKTRRKWVVRKNNS